MLSDVIHILGAYRQACRLSRIADRQVLLDHQQRELRNLQEALQRSPFYRDIATAPFDRWPVMNKLDWMQYFDAINTAGISRVAAEQVALQAERDRNFSTDIDGVTVGLSTGTSGARGVFLASRSERQRWAGTVLAKLLPRGLLQRERIALLLRADSRLYSTIATGSWMAFRFFDTTRPLEVLANELLQFNPTILVGPPSALLLLAGHLPQSRTQRYLRRVVCGAEVLSDADRSRLEMSYGAPVAEIYQATEGFLGATCRAGRMHLNEELLIVEKQWLDQPQRRFVPIVTDLYRHVQPVVRYRLNDVLTASTTACTCGAATTVIDRIEGREDDIFWARRHDGAGWVPLFPDVLSRALLASAGGIDEYEMIQTHENRWRVLLTPGPDADMRARLNEGLCEFVERQAGVRPELIIDTRHAAMQLPAKRRRVRREWQPEFALHA